MTKLLGVVVCAIGALGFYYLVYSVPGDQFFLSLVCGLMMGGGFSAMAGLYD